MVTTKLNLSMTEPQVRQIYAKQGDTGRVLDITLDQTPEDGTLRILRPDGTEVTSEAVTGGEVSESGETVTFESMTEADVTELTVGIEPVQNLNGYDAPWVGGAGKNLYNASAIGNLSSYGITATISNGTITLNGTATANAFFSIHNTGYANQQYTFSFNNPVANSGVHISFRDTNGNYFSDASANTVNRVLTFTNEPSSIMLYVVSGTTLSNFVVKPQLEVGSTATEWQPYSNICPITGHDEVRVTRTGKNLNPWQGVNYSASVSRTIWLNEGTYILSTDNGNYLGGNNAIYFAHYDANGNNITEGAISSTQLTLNGGKTFYYGSLRSSYVFTILKEGLYSFGFNNEVPSNVGALQLELGSTATAYEPYRSNIYTTSLGQTVYGGTLDMVTGVLTVDRAMVDMGSLNWIKYDTAQGTLFRSGSIADASSSMAYNSTNFICSNYATAQSAARTNGTISCGMAKSVDVIDNNFSDASSFKTAMNGVQLVYQLATPVEYQLTPQQIKTLVGTNNVWASSGDIVSITFTYGGLLAELPSDATEIVGKCYCDVEQNGVSSMPFTLNVKKNERES